MDSSAADYANLYSIGTSNKADPESTEQRHKVGADPLNDDDDDEDHEFSDNSYNVLSLLRHDEGKRFLEVERAESLTNSISAKIQCHPQPGPITGTRRLERAKARAPWEPNLQAILQGFG